MYCVFYMLFEMHSMSSGNNYLSLNEPKRFSIDPYGGMHSNKHYGLQSHPVSCYSVFIENRELVFNIINLASITYNTRSIDYLVTLEAQTNYARVG